MLPLVAQQLSEIQAPHKLYAKVPREKKRTKYQVWLDQPSNEKKGPWLFVVYRGWKTTQLYGDYNKTIIRIPINQPGFNGK